MSKIILLIEIR